MAQRTEARANGPVRGEGPRSICKCDGPPPGVTATVPRGTRSASSSCSSSKTKARALWCRELRHERRAQSEARGQGQSACATGRRQGPPPRSSRGTRSAARYLKFKEQGPGPVASEGARAQSEARGQGQSASATGRRQGPLPRSPAAHGLRRVLIQVRGARLGPCGAVSSWPGSSQLSMALQN